MNINELVPSFETGKEAKELGFPQETQFYYHDSDNIIHRSYYHDTTISACSAPSLQEVLAVLPDRIVHYQEETTYWLTITKTEFKDDKGLIYIVCYRDDYNVVGDLYNIRHVNPAQAALELWIKLKKDDVI